MSSSDSLISLDGIRNLVQDAHVNFLIGAGASRPYMPVLNNLETLSAEVDSVQPTADQKNIIQVSLDYSYYAEVMKKNSGILTDTQALAVLEDYEKFISAIHGILSKRSNPLLPKQANLFTTNIDLFLENGFDRTGIELNDGFKGHLNPTFRLDNFRTRLFKLTLQYDNNAEVPVFNLYKLHGSLSWMLDRAKGKQKIIELDGSLEALTKLDKLAKKISKEVLPINDETTAESLIAAAGSKMPSKDMLAFAEEYKTLMVVNPTKEKFETTVLQQTYYDLLRIFSNELEREASVLFVTGFSFADEHIRSLAVRAANSNPTLIICIFCHSAKSKVEIEAEFADEIFTYGNVRIIAPSDMPDGEAQGITEFDLKNITRVLFAPIGESTDLKFKDVKNENTDNES